MKRIRTKSELQEILESEELLNNLSVENVDLTGLEEKLKRAEVLNCYFLGCEIDKPVLNQLLERENYILPKMSLPYTLFQDELYTKETLINGYDKKDPNSYRFTKDFKIYTHFLANGKTPKSPYVGFARNLHDHSVEVAMQKYLENWDDRKVIGIMGGHQILRNDPEYLKVAFISKRLTEDGYLMVSGGGPGMMEATHLGAWFAGRHDNDLVEATLILSESNLYSDRYWLSKAFEVIEQYPQISNYQSLGVPTWVYGHEPPNPFPTKIAKFFSVSVRQEGLLKIASGGIIYTPGSAGTIREIFQDAEQNHYMTYGPASPMVFLGKDYWGNKVPVYNLIKNLSDKGFYKNMDVFIFDEIDEVVQTFIDNANE